MSSTAKFLSLTDIWLHEGQREREELRKIKGVEAPKYMFSKAGIHKVNKCFLLKTRVTVPRRFH